MVLAGLFKIVCLVQGQLRHTLHQHSSAHIACAAWPEVIQAADGRHKGGLDGQLG